MTPARDAALARQAQELAEGEVVSTELPIVRELREENARLRELCDQVERRLLLFISSGWGVGKDDLRDLVRELQEGVPAARAAEGATDHG